MPKNTFCSIHPYFKVPKGKMLGFKTLCERFMAKTQQEPGCLYYGFSFNGNEAFCREGYESADALLAHIENVGAIFEVALQLVELTRLEVHGPSTELDKLRGPLSELNVEYFAIEYDYQR